MSETEPRQAVLLAAGTGTRLLPRTLEMPKCMVEVAGRTLVDRLLDAVDAELAIEETIIVTGHRPERLRDHLGDRRGEMAIRYVHNERFDSTNNILSLYAAREAIDRPFVLLESDLCVGPGVLGTLRELDRAVVAPYTAEMDGTGVALDEDGRVVEMILGAHRVAPERLPSLHKTVNFYSFSMSLWKEHYLPALTRWVEAERLDQYYEAVLAELINAGRVSLGGRDVGGRVWAEVDDEHDLARAAALLGD